MKRSQKKEELSHPCFVAFVRGMTKVLAEKIYERENELRF